MSINFVVAFGPNQSYYFSNGHQSLWNSVPEGFGNILRNDARFRPDKVLSVALGPNSAYFVRSADATGWDNISPALENKVMNIGGWTSISWILFTPDPNVALILGLDGLLHNLGLSQEFHEAILRYAFYGFKDICLGYGGGFALTTNNEQVYYKGMPDEFVKAWKIGKILQITTSTFDQFYFIEFADGRSSYRCPKEWHNAIDQMRNAVRRTSSGTFINPLYAAPSVPTNFVYPTEQQYVGQSEVTGFISDTASDFAMQMMVGLMGGILGN